MITTQLKPVQSQNPYIVISTCIGVDIYIICVHVSCATLDLSLPINVLKSLKLELEKYYGIVCT